MYYPNQIARGVPDEGLRSGDRSMDKDFEPSSPPNKA
jgi:hypothetical protein